MAREVQNLALFDMDGTLCDHDSALRRDMRKIAAPEEILPKNFFKVKEGTHLKRRMDMIRRQEGWWRNLKPFKLGFDVLKVAKKLGFEVYILTKGPTSKSKAWTEKLEWVRRYLGKTKVIITEDKSIVYGKVLVDDYPGYVEGWLKNRPRGLVIMPASEGNKNFRHPRVVRYDGTNLKEVKRALKRAKERQGKEPL